MKLSAAKKPKEQVQELASMLPIGKQVQVSFSKHTDVAVLVSCTLATLDSIKQSGGNPVQKRMNEQGKETTPATVTLHFNNGSDFWFHLPLIEIDVYQKIGGVILKVPSAEISIMEKG